MQGMFTVYGLQRKFKKSGPGVTCYLKSFFYLQKWRFFWSTRNYLNYFHNKFQAHSVVDPE